MTRTLLLSALLWLSVTAGFRASALDYTWTTPSRNSAGSMPVGGGGVGLNVWCDTTGYIQFYVSQSGAFDENNTLLKAGRFGMAPFTHWEQGGFSQTLHTDDGSMTLEQGGVTVTIWCDVMKPVVHVEVDSKQPACPVISYQSWRTDDVPLLQSEGQQSSWKWLAPKKPADRCVTRHDSIVAQSDRLIFCHQNADFTVFDYTVSTEGLEAWRDSLYNPLKRRHSGGMLTGGMLCTASEDADDTRHAATARDAYGRTYRQWCYKSARGNARHHHFEITLCCQQSTPEAWMMQLETTHAAVSISKDRKASLQWWAQYMSRATFSIPAASSQHDTACEAALRNATLFRYMLGCNYSATRGDDWPTKFNGGLFVFDPLEVDSINTANWKNGKFNPTPDYRRWGGGTHTAQNQRLVYWPMLKSGDLDLLRTQLDFYLRLLPNAELRTRAYWHHEGASFTEQMENFGLPNPAEYGQKRPATFDPGLEYNAWLEYLWDTSLEFCEMALLAHRYDAGFSITDYEPLILSCLKFFDQHYQQLALQRGRKALDGDGHLVLYPGTGCETYKMAYNSSSTIAALQRVTADYGRYLTERDDTLTLPYIKQLQARIPSIPTRMQRGKECIAPAIAYERINNTETPQLYPVWPWRISGMQTLGINTYQNDSIALRNRTHIGWKQDNIWAACLGMTDEAYALTMQKLQDGPYRFPAFWGPGYDWSPDHNWGGSALIGLEEMLLQEDPETGEISVLPAWPKDKDISFKLHATNGRIVEVEQKDGKITQKITEKFGNTK